MPFCTQAWTWYRTFRACLNPSKNSDFCFVYVCIYFLLEVRVQTFMYVFLEQTDAYSNEIQDFVWIKIPISAFRTIRNPMNLFKYDFLRLKKVVILIMFAFYCLQGNVTFSCSEPQIVPITFLSSSRSYLLLPGTPQIDGLSVSFQFRTWNKDGLLLSTELSENSGSLLVYLHGGRLTLLIQKVAEDPVEISEGTLFLFSLTFPY